MSRIRELLDRAAADHRRDIGLYCSGHLNENRLWKPPEKQRVSWESSSSASLLPVLRPPVPFRNHPVRREQDRNNQTTTAMLDFSLGTLWPERKPISASIRSRVPPSSPTSEMPDSNLQTERAERIASISNSDLGTVKTVTPLKHSEKSHQSVRVVKQLSLKTDFLGNPLKRVTKVDQYKEYKRVNDDVVETSQSHQRQALQRTKTIEEIEQKLQRQLSLLNEKRHVPSYHRLRIYSGCLDDVIANCETFGPLLRRIQIEFDCHVSSLLDRHASLKQSDLRRKLEVVSLQPSVSEELQRAQKNVEKLEAKAKKLLQRNENLRDELRSEREVTEGSIQTGGHTPRPGTLHSLRSASQGRPPATGQTTGSTRTSVLRKDLAERVEDMHYDILQQLEAREEIKQKQKLEMVPSVECQRLEQCIKETEASIQKLAKHNEYLQGKINELEADLEDALETTSAPQKDIKMLWKRANAFRVVQAAGQGKP